MRDYKILMQQVVLMLLFVFAFSYKTSAQEIIGSDPRVDVYGDFRFRIEDDWGTSESDGQELEGRTRARVRVRLGATYSPDEHVALGLRIRSGLLEGQQIANITIYDFNGNNTGDADFEFDKWYLEYRVAGLSTWIGRNSIPYWKQNELYWDDDVMPVGFGATYGGILGQGNFEVNGGLFSLPAGAQAFSGSLLLGQILYQQKIGGIQLSTSAGLMAIRADLDDPDRLVFLENNGNRDYTTWQVSLQTKAKVGNIPLRLGLDLAFNTEGYKDAPPGSFTEFHRDEVNGYVLSAILGEAREPGDLKVGYSYAYVELFAVNNSFAQDDWVRWGTAEQVRDSNFKGHDFLVVIALPARFSAMVRLFMVEGIKLRTPASTRKEDGNRLRFDLNYQF